LYKNQNQQHHKFNPLKIATFFSCFRYQKTKENTSYAMSLIATMQYGKSAIPDCTRQNKSTSGCTIRKTQIVGHIWPFLIGLIS